MYLFNFNYLCSVDETRQFLVSIIGKSLSSFFSRSGSSGTVFSCLKIKTPVVKPGCIMKRSVSKIFDCVGLTKPQPISKLSNSCYLRFYAAILSNVAELTTLKKQSQMVFSQYLKWQLTCKSSIDNKTAFCLVSVVKKIKKNCFLPSLSKKGGF